jgi:hypothetical protein
MLNSSSSNDQMVVASDLGGVNHCTSHCSPTKFRDLMIHAKYSAVIG